MGFRKQMGRLIVALLPLLAISCADDGPVAVDAFYNLTCPPPAAEVECGAFAESTCLRPVGGPTGEREILGLNGDISCDGVTPLIAICEATQRSDGALIINLVAAVGDQFAFNLSGAAVDPNDSMVSGSCEITIIEDELSYGGNLGMCGMQAPSMEQPCQISNVAVGEVDGVDLSFDLECMALSSRTTERSFDVGGPNGGPARIQFARCTGLR